MFRIARIAGWTYEEMVRQPLSYVYALAANAMMENKAIRASTGNPSSGSAPGAPGRQRIIRYVMKPTCRRRSSGPGGLEPPHDALGGAAM